MKLSKSDLNLFECDLKELRAEQKEVDHAARTKILKVFESHKLPENALQEVCRLIEDGESWPMTAAMINKEAEDLLKPPAKGDRDEEPRPA